MDTKPAYLLGLDLGKKRDFTALVVLKQVETLPAREYTYDLIHLDRWRGKNYRDAIPVIEQVIAQVRQAAFREHFAATGDGSVDGFEPVIALVVDQTGVGEAVIEDLRAAGLACVGITITGGDTTTRQEGGFRVPKRELVSTVEVLLQNRRLRIAESLPLAKVLVDELDNFKTKITLATGHDTYGAEEWREGVHDDCVLAVALAAWLGEEQDPVGRQRFWDEVVAAFSR